MQDLDLDLLDVQNFIKKLKEYVQHEVKIHVDKKTEETKDKVAIRVTNKVLNNMVGNKPPSKPRRVNQVYDAVQNQEAIRALFVGKTLTKVYGKRKHEVKVNSPTEFVYDGEIYKSLSTVGNKINGTKSCGGWNFFRICLDPKEGLKTLCYHRSKFFSNR
ncbi:DUF2924 domain-containing protein [Wolbachia endosymbiont of Folsomia candida]|uniref:DUF2924 domain-containing protein n=1 Tax=Wolbachia endosymbiont of Folsomia candida TaxID=169402 RepID=UPI000B30F13C|nr:DUF2924 domain-containing protein [Wolbachia endosymbiont of Folsomia candida]APR98411.1 hypothetical protein ASM33_03950 [Wolbachia endosymbiont of Folsomia candida]